MPQAIIDRIKAAYEQEQKSNALAINADDIPISYEAITSEWLTKVLWSAYPGVEVISHSLDVADDGTTNRRRLFMKYNEAGIAANLPGSLFCKSSHGLLNRIVLGVSGAMHSEVTFYRKVGPLLDIETPQCYFATYDPASMNSIVMLDDLGHETQFCNHRTDMTLQRAQGQMRLLAAFHGRFYESPELAAALAPLPTWKEFFDNTNRMGLEPACRNGFNAAQEVMPARLFARADEVWPATLASVAQHSKLPHTLIHCDVHLKNWYITPQGEMGLSDWQCCSRGHWSRDLAYTIATALTVEQRRLWENDLVRYYHDELQRVVGRSLPFDGVMALYRQQMFTALAWWTVTLSPAEGMPDMQPRDVTLEFLKRISTAVDDLDALDSFK